MCDNDRSKTQDIELVAENMTNELEPLTGILKAVSEAVRPIIEATRSMAQALMPLFEGFAIYAIAAKGSEDHGLLPHYSVPFHEFVGSGITYHQFYAKHESTIVAAVESRLDEYDVDDEDRETLREAIQIHKSSNYRLVCPALIPRIEKVLREEWLLEKEVAVLREKSIQQNLEHYYLDDFVVDGPADIVLFGGLAKGLFSYVKDKQQLQDTLLPNRHAASHGWADYADKQSSLNAIIYTDYFFRVITSLKAQSRIPGQTTSSGSCAAS